MIEACTMTRTFQTERIQMMKTGKRIWSAATAVGMLAGMLGNLPGGMVFAEGNVYGDLTYAVQADGTIQITDCDEAAVTVEIPAEIDGMAVTSIGKGAFFQCVSLEHVTIPDSVTVVKSIAFSSCTALTELEFPDSVTEIGENAVISCKALTSVRLPANLTTISAMMLSKCESLASVTIPDSVTTIGENAFYGCKSLQQIEIPANVTEISKNAFWDCTALQAFQVAPENASFCAQEGVLYSKDLTRLVRCPEQAAVCHIPETVTSIDTYAFSKCICLTELDLPDNLLYLNENVFEKCSALERVTLPSQLTVITAGAFLDCSALQEIQIPKTVKKIGVSSFAGCISMQNFYVEAGNADYQSEDGLLLTDNGKTLFFFPNGKSYFRLPASVETIGASSCAYSDNLTEIVIPEGVTAIEGYAFVKCGSLKKLVLPDSLDTLGINAFSNCEALETIKMPSAMTEIRSGVFSRAAITEITVPSGLTEIPNYLFSGCKNLKTVTMPNSVAKVGIMAFQKCDALADVYFQGTKAQWDTVSISDYADLSTNQSGNLPLTDQATIHFLDTPPVVTTTATTPVTTGSTTTTASSVVTTASATGSQTTSSVQTSTTVTGTVVVPEVLYGDVNLDGTISLSDAVLLNKRAADMVTFSEQASANADCNTDDEVNGADAIVLLQFLVNIIQELPYTV